MPVTGIGDGAAAPAFAFARCTVDAARSDEFRRELAGEIVRGLRPDVAPNRVFVQFEPVLPQLHITGSEIVEKS